MSKPEGDDFIVIKKDGKKPIVKRDGRKKKISNRAKHLKYMRIKPLVCNDCPYSAVEAGGNGVCTKYKADSICTVRPNLEKITTELDTRDPDLLKSKLDLLTTQLSEEVAFHIQLCKAGNIPPTKELIAAYKASLEGMKIMSEIQRKTITNEISETETISDGETTQIHRVIREQRNETTD